MKKLIRKLTENDRTTVKDEVILIIFTLLLIICAAVFFVISGKLGKELYAAFFTAGVMTALTAMFFVIIIIYRIRDNIKIKKRESFRSSLSRKACGNPKGGARGRVRRREIPKKQKKKPQ